MAGLIDKNAVGVGVRQFHVGVAPGEVGTVALLPGGSVPGAAHRRVPRGRP